MTALYSSAAAAQAAAKRTSVYPLTWNPTDHLLRRFTFGPTPMSRADSSLSTPDSWWANQVSLGQSRAGYAGDAVVASLGPALSTSGPQARAMLMANGGPSDSTITHQLSTVTLGLQLYSQAQLYEVLVDFFANHLNVYIWNGNTASTRHLFDRDVVRRYVFGSFSDMLLASSKNPAMLTYLNEAQSSKAALNQNYAREIMELHTVGLKYTESDVDAAAMLLSGRTVDTTTMTYRYDPTLHATGAVKILGFASSNASAAAGEAAGDAFVRYLAGHRQTAMHLAQKLCLRFVSDSPSSRLVADIAQVYLDSGTAILPTVQAITRSAEFWASRGAKTRRPAENMIAAARALGSRSGSASATAIPDLRWKVTVADNDPLAWLPPNGYPDTAASWRSAGNIIQEWNAHRAMALGYWAGTTMSSAPALLSSPATAGEAVDQLCRALTGQTFQSRHRDVLLSYTGDTDATPWARARAASMVNGLAALVLDSPYHALR